MRVRFVWSFREAALMPRYFFNTRIGDDVIPDAEGEELRDTDHAWEVAKAADRSAREPTKETRDEQLYPP